MELGKQGVDTRKGVCYSGATVKERRWFWTGIRRYSGFAQLWWMEFTPGQKAQVIGIMVPVFRDPWISGA